VGKRPAQGRSASETAPLKQIARVVTGLGYGLKLILWDLLGNLGKLYLHAHKPRTLSDATCDDSNPARVRPNTDTITRADTAHRHGPLLPSPLSTCLLHNHGCAYLREETRGTARWLALW